MNKAFQVNCCTDFMLSSTLRDSQENPHYVCEPCLSTPCPQIPEQKITLDVMKNQFNIGRVCTCRARSPAWRLLA